MPEGTSGKCSMVSWICLECTWANVSPVCVICDSPRPVESEQGCGVAEGGSEGGSTQGCSSIFPASLGGHGASQQESVVDVSRCWTCGYFSTGDDDLRVHVNTRHTLEGHHLCTAEGCTFACKSKAALKEHMKSHALALATASLLPTQSLQQEQFDSGELAIAQFTEAQFSVVGSGSAAGRSYFAVSRISAEEYAASASSAASAAAVEVRGLASFRPKYSEGGGGGSSSSSSGSGPAYIAGDSLSTSFCRRGIKKGSISAPHRGVAKSKAETAAAKAATAAAAAAAAAVAAAAHASGSVDWVDSLPGPPFFCKAEKCNYSTADRKRLSKHWKTHTGEADKFFCCVCHFATHKNSLFRAHMKEHVDNEEL